MILIFFGLPGSGKGTQASLIAKKFNIPHLSTGDILRKKLLDQNNLSKKLKEIMDSGNLVSDEILNKIVVDRIMMQDCKKGFILDGYPRTTHQRVFLSNFLKKNELKINKIMHLKLDQNVIVKRINSRLDIENREDDKDNVIKTRIYKYIHETKPILEFYKGNYKNDYHLIDANQEIEMIQADIEKIIKNTNFH